MTIRWLGLLGLAIGITCYMLCLAVAADPSATKDPIGLFVREGESWDGDFFINGKTNTILFRVIQDMDGDGLKDLALSEISTWGNTTGSWVTFMRRKDGTYARDLMAGRHNPDESLIEWCATRAYDKKKGYQWKKGYPSGEDIERYAPFKVHPGQDG